MRAFDILYTINIGTERKVIPPKGVNGIELFELGEDFVDIKLTFVLFGKNIFSFQKRGKPHFSV